jgi:hypothetical protein
MSFARVNLFQNGLAAEAETTMPKHIVRARTREMSFFITFLLVGVFFLTKVYHHVKAKSI